MKVAIPAEADSEPRVAATPDTVKKLKAYADVVVQSGAGVKSGLLDADYEAAGATIAQSAADAVRDADVVLKVRRPEEAELASYKPGALVLAIMDPYGADDALAAMAKANVVGFAMELMPRITRAQVMDVLSIAGEPCGLPRGDRRRRRVRARVPDDDDGGRHGPGCARVRDGRRRCGSAGDCDGTAARCGRHRDRRAAGDERAGREPWREIPRGRGRGIQERADRRRLRQGNVEGVPGEAGSPRCRAHQEAGPGDHHRAHPGPSGTAAHLGRDGEVDEAGLGDRRSRGRARRQCRGREGGRSGARRMA